MRYVTQNLLRGKLSSLGIGVNRVKGYKGNSSYKGNSAYKGVNLEAAKKEDEMGRNKEALEDAKKGKVGQTKSNKFRMLKRYLRNKYQSERVKEEIEIDRDDDILDAVDEARDDRKEDREKQEQEAQEDKEDKETI